MNVRRLAAMIVGSAVLLAGCGSDVPSKTEFVSKMKTSLRTQLDDMEKAGLDRGDAEKLFEDFVGCTYDQIKSDEDLVTKVYEEGTDAGVDAQLEKKAGACVTQLTKAAEKLTSGATSG